MAKEERRGFRGGVGSAEGGGVSGMKGGMERCCRGVARSAR